MSKVSGAAVINRSQYFLRVELALKKCVTEALFNILHNKIGNESYEGLPNNSADFYQIMHGFQSKVDLYNDQKKVICPPSTIGQPGRTDSRTLDITLLSLVIEHGIPQLPESIKEHCMLARNLRNDVDRCVIADIVTEAQFEVYWRRINNILLGLRFSVDGMKLFEDLKVCSLDPILKEITDILSNRPRYVECGKSGSKEFQQLKDILLQRSIDLEKKVDNLACKHSELAKEVENLKSNKCDVSEDMIETDIQSDQPTGEKLLQVSEAIVDYWYQLGIRFKISIATLDGIKRDFHNSQEKAFKMLMVWKEKYKSSATCKYLNDTLKEHGKLNTALELFPSL